MAGLVPATHDLRDAANVFGLVRVSCGEAEIMDPRDKPGDDCGFGQAAAICGAKARRIWR